MCCRKGFSLDQISQIGDQLQVIQNHITQISCIIMNAYPVQHRAGKIVNEFALGGIEDLRDSLNNQALIDYGPGGQTAKAFFKNGQPEFFCPEYLPGVRQDRATQFELMQKRKNQQNFNHRPGLSVTEIQILLDFFNYSINTVETIILQIITSYGEEHPSVKMAEFSITRFKKLKYEIMTLEHGPEQEVKA